MLNNRKRSDITTNTSFKWFRMICFLKFLLLPFTLPLQLINVIFHKITASLLDNLRLSINLWLLQLFLWAIFNWLSKRSIIRYFLMINFSYCKPHSPKIKLSFCKIFLCSFNRVSFFLKKYFCHYHQSIKYSLQLQD